MMIRAFGRQYRFPGVPAESRMDLGSDEDYVVLEKAGIDVIGAFALAFLIDDKGD
jgi:hypothetical protein